MEIIRQIVAYKNYFLDFYNDQADVVQVKIEWTLNLIRVTKQLPEKYFKYLKGTQGLFEIRIEYGNSTFRVFSFFDKGNLIVLGNAFRKKSRKTPMKELEKAVKIKEEYFNEKANK
jgi:phage-related protein